jgi:hypothetical protein
MNFINERISNEDVAKYGLEAIDKNFIVGGTNRRDWTIDRERDICLRNVTNGREEYKSQSGWTLFWGGQWFYLELEVLDSGGKPGGPCWAHKRLRRMELPEQLKGKRDEILADLKGALTVYKDSGIFSVSTEYTLTLDV